MLNVIHLFEFRNDLKDGLTIFFHVVFLGPHLVLYSIPSYQLGARLMLHFTLYNGKAMIITDTPEKH